MTNRFPQRKPLRMPEFDYSQDGAYYVTLCTHNKDNLLADVNCVGADPCVRPNAAGLMVEQKLHALETKFEGVTLDYYCVMPNHIHFVIFKSAEPGGHTGPPLQMILQWLKTQTTNEYIKMVKNGILPPFDKRFWQRSYYEHVVRGDNDLFEIRRYIEENPLKWINDKYYR
jgi:REP element-mobilizing transposase RayT